MKIFSTFAHGVFDYIGGVALLFAPEIFGFSQIGGAAVLVARAIGIIVLLQALATDYELGVIRILPMRAHLMNDYVAGLFLAISPWLFGFINQPTNAWAPHLVVGISVFVFTLLTEPVPRGETAAALHSRM